MTTVKSTPQHLMKLEMQDASMSAGEWNRTLLELGQPSLLQSWQWGEVKEQYGWHAAHKLWKNEKGRVFAAALVLQREQRLPLSGKRLKILYVPKGPLLNWKGGIADKVFADLQAYARQIGAVYIKCDPDLILARGIDGQADHFPEPAGEALLQGLIGQGWALSRQQIQFKNTFWIDLTASEQELLSAMKQKTRYNIRLAEKKGVEVRIATIDELNMFYEMYLETAQRDGFIVRPRDYYLTLWRTFITAGLVSPLLAQVGDEAVAGLLLFHFGKRSWYLYGMSRDLHREKMPNYFLQWRAMLTSKALGCTIYDLWGAPDEFNQSDRMWGVSKFKEGLGGYVVQTPGALDYPAKPFEYKIIQEFLPRLQHFTRTLRRRQIRQELSE